MRTRKGLALLAFACSPLCAQYTYYYTDSLTSINASNWTQNGTLTAGSGGLTSSNSNGGSLISKVAVPDGSSNYEVKTTLTLTQSGGTYVLYLRASSNALSGPADAGTTYAAELQNPTFSGSACTATLATYKIVSGTVTAILSSMVPCNNGMTIRAVRSAISNQLVFYVNNTAYYAFQDSTIASGQPGIGVRGAPAGNSISEVQLGGIYPGPVTMPPTNEISVSAFANKVEIQWPGASDGANGPGVAFYEVFRNGTYLTEPNTQRFVDTEVSPSTTYTYWIQALDYDLNQNLVSFNVTTPPAGSIDARETGLRPTGAYWGGGGEEIDMLSGNLNYTMPLIKAMGRGGWSVGFNLTYNAQNWRQDPGGTWQLGQDVGYGYGWKLLAGSLLPLLAPGGTIGEYLFTDSTGAQYHLNQDNGGIWTSLESTYVFFNAATNTLYFTDGSHWTMGCTSAGTEWDAGTMYPTLMEDSNGNEVIITYNDGVGVTWSNSSSRIKTIEDVRGYGSADYTFTYNTDAIPHLTGITNTIGTAENYGFAYNESYSLLDPFARMNFGTVTLLESSTVTGIPLTTYFTYDTSSATASCSGVGTGTSGPAQLTQVTTPYCGHLRWTYTTANTLSGSRSYNEVQNRYLSMSSGAAETEISLVRATDTGNTVHSSATLQDSPANAEKIWNFQTSTSSPYLGLETSYEELTLSTGTGLMLENFTWAQTPTSLNPYIGTTVTKLNPGQTYEADKQTTQTLDQYGNVLTVQAYNFGAAGGGVGSLARTTTNTFLYQSHPTYASYYVLNRLLTSTVTDGTNTATAVSNTYDPTPVTCLGSGCPTCIGPPLAGQISICEHDNVNYPPSFKYRGNLSTSTTPTTITGYGYDEYGTGTVAAQSVNGVSTTIASTGSYAAPSAVTTDGTSTMNWTSFLGLSSATGPNGDTGSINYDSNARPIQTTSPYGAVTGYTYNDTASPPNKIATTDGHWVKTVMDGLGRTIQTITGYGSTTVSTVDSQYAPCGCSPLGKLYQQSQPYAPGGSDAWTTYTYDASGRTLTQVLPDGSTTTYQYNGNSVTVTDPAGKWKTYQLDAFSNLVAVTEPDPNLGHVSTTYTYDVLNHLTQVSMPRGSSGTQTRTFNYNSGTTVTGLLQSATNPENGTVTYTYNSGTNTLATKTDGNSQELVYEYDSYNRLTSVNLQPPYTCPPPPQQCNPPPLQVLRNYYYDTNPLDTTGFSKNITGRLAAVKYGPVLNEPVSPTGAYAIQLNDMYTYTSAGLPAAKRLQVNEQATISGTNGTGTANLDTTFTYNDEGQVIQTTYPSTGYSNSPTAGPTYNFSYDSMYRLTGMTSGTIVTGFTTIVSNVSYNAANQLLGMTMNGISETRQYNSLNQLTNIIDSQGATIENLTYNYATGANNGKASSVYNAVSGETVTYTYDSLNRIATANGSGWGQSYGFDPFGNLLSKTVTAGSGPSLSQTVNPANNQVGGLTYDGNGNATTIYNGTTLYNPSYDIENHMTRIFNAWGYVVMYYAYDAQNRRMATWSGTQDPYGNPTDYTINVYTPGGQKLGAYNIQPALQSGHIVLLVTLTSSDQYFGSRRLAVMDQLGSAGSYFPWGEPRGNQLTDSWNFATYWQDSVTGLDYAVNRYYSNAYGRFMTPDPYMASGGAGDPQSWNRYAYTRGDPVNRFDPVGTCDQSGDTDTSVTVCAGGVDTLTYNNLVDLSTSTPGLLDNWWSSQMASATSNALQQASQLLISSAQQYMQAAMDSALQALKDPTCAKDFETSGSLAAGFNPTTVFNELYGNIGTSGIGFGQATVVNGTPIASEFLPSWLMPGWPLNTPDAATAPSLFVGTSGVSTGTAVYINAAEFASNGAVGDTDLNAAVLLHELGHVLNSLFPGASQITADNGNSTQSQNNTLKILQDCGLAQH